MEREYRTGHTHGIWETVTGEGLVGSLHWFYGKGLGSSAGDVKFVFRRGCPNWGWFYRTQRFEGGEITVSFPTIAVKTQNTGISYKIHRVQ